MIQCERVCSWVLYKIQKLTKFSYRVQGSKIAYSIMHLALLHAVKRLIQFWKEFDIDYLHYSDHKNFEQVGRNCWTASKRICTEATWIWWGKKIGNQKITKKIYIENFKDIFEIVKSWNYKCRCKSCRNGRIRNRIQRHVW